MNDLRLHKIQEQYRNGSFTIREYLDALLQLYTGTKNIPKQDFPIDTTWFDDLPPIATT